MVLEIPGKILGQDDVRETPTAEFVQANFNSSDFNVDSESVVNLKNKTSYASVAPSGFTPLSPDVLDHSHFGTFVRNNGGTSSFFAAVQLPDGAVVTGAVAYGDNAAKTWNFIRVNSGGTSNTMASANINTEDTSISNATVDNSTYSYYFEISLDSTDKGYGARVTYTTDYI